MPAQTTERSYMKVPDGCKISVKAYGDVSYTDIGVVKGSTKLALQWKELQEESANAGKSDLYVKDPTVDGSFTLQNLNLANVSKMASGLFNLVATAGSALTSIVDQVVAAGWDDNIKYPLIMKTSATDDTLVKMAVKPTLTSVTLSVGSSPETLTEIGAGAAGDYMIIADANSVSGWSIAFNSAGITKGSPKTYAITIVYGSNTPVARSTYHIGTTVKAVTSFAMLLEHTDSAGKIRGREVHKCYVKPGSLNFDFKGADEDGFEEMAFTFQGVLDTSLTDERQLMSVYEDTGAI